MNHFTVIKRLGTGTSASVTLCRTLPTIKIPNLPPNTIVAVKSIPLPRLASSEKHLSRLESEVTVLKRLSHVNIIGLLNIVWDDVSVGIVMEVCDEGCLREYCKRVWGGVCAIPEIEARFFFRQLMNGLKYLWEKHIIHRDLKRPDLAAENILLKGDVTRTTLPVLKIADFGLSKITLNLESKESAAWFGEKIGTLLYMAPEILTTKFYDARCDLWSCGVVFYELLVGSTPFDKAAGESMDSLLEALTSQNPGVLSIPNTSSVNISKSATELISRLLTRNPNNRITFQQTWNNPYLDLQHVPSPTSITFAHELITKALSLDESLASGNAKLDYFDSNRILEIERLITFYIEAVEYLFAHVQFTCDRTTEPILKAKDQIQQCMERVEVRSRELEKLKKECSSSRSRRIFRGMQKLFGKASRVGTEEEDELSNQTTFALPFSTVPAYFGSNNTQDIRRRQRGLINIVY